MASAAAYHPNDSYKMPLSVSLLLHGALAGLAVFGAMHSQRGDSWGGPGGSVTVGIVGNVPAIPLPHPDVSTTSRTVDNSKGLYKAEPPKIEPALRPIRLRLMRCRFRNLKRLSRLPKLLRDRQRFWRTRRHHPPMRSLTVEAERLRFPPRRSPWDKGRHRAG